MEEIIEYLIDFLLGTSGFKRYVEYASVPSQSTDTKIFIRKSNFFVSDNYFKPEFPLKNIEGIPILFGEDSITIQNGVCIIEADIIASTYYLVARVDELLNIHRDSHGRFLAKWSVAYKGKFIRRPIVEEYGVLLRKYLRIVGVDIPEPENGFSAVISHDLDIPFKYRTFRSFVGGIIHNDFRVAFSSYFKDIKNDPYFVSLRRMCNTEKKKKSVTSILFLKTAGRNLSQDLPYYDPYSKDISHMVSIFENVGLHLSYESSLNPINAQSELLIAESVLEQKVVLNRNHYLASLDPADMEYLEKIGITDDYTMGYADCIGFRLGTCRPVRYINPYTRKLSNLVLHPLNIMDCTLYRKKYMGLNFNQALRLSIQVRNVVEEYGGEFNMLWHNSNISSYYVKLYNAILKTLK